LKKALVAIEQGQDGFECLKRCGLLGAVDLAVLRAALRNGNLAWAAQEMADSNRRRFQYVTIAWMQTIFPAVILVLACIVGFVAVAMFMPLVTLILSLSGAKL
jgi:type II secretory pathway component PulF